MTQKHPIVMLPARRSPLGYIHEFGEAERIDLAIYYGFELFDPTRNFQHKPLHLYILSGEPIKKDDWYVYKGKLMQAYTDAVYPQAELIGCKKVIASTDFNITPECMIHPILINRYIGCFNMKDVMLEVDIEMEHPHDKAVIDWEKSTFNLVHKVTDGFIEHGE